MDRPRLLASSFVELSSPELDTSDFPVVAGFTVRLRDTGPFGFHVDLCDGSGNELAGFPWLDHADAHLEALLTQLRSATADAPFSDLEQGWEILIWRDSDRFFVMEGRGEPYGHYSAWRASAPTSSSRLR